MKASSLWILASTCPLLLYLRFFSEWFHSFYEDHSVAYALCDEFVFVAIQVTEGTASEESAPDREVDHSRPFVGSLQGFLRSVVELIGKLQPHVTLFRTIKAKQQ
jgi:hypothetical protein